MRQTDSAELGIIAIDGDGPLVATRRSPVMADWNLSGFHDTRYPKYGEQRAFEALDEAERFIVGNPLLPDLVSTVPGAFLFTGYGAKNVYWDEDRTVAMRTVVPLAGGAKLVERLYREGEVPPIRGYQRGQVILAVINEFGKVGARLFRMPRRLIVCAAHRRMSDLRFSLPEVDVALRQLLALSGHDYMGKDECNKLRRMIGTISCEAAALHLLQELGVSLKPRATVPPAGYDPIMHLDQCVVDGSLDIIRRRDGICLGSVSFSKSCGTKGTAFLARRNGIMRRGRMIMDEGEDFATFQQAALDVLENPLTPGVDDGDSASADESDGRVGQPLAEINRY